MATDTAGGVGQVYVQNMVHYLSKTITYADNGTTVTIGTLPAGAVVIPGISGIAVNTAFDGDTTNTSDIGITGSTTKYASALALGTAGWIELDVITEASASDLSNSADVDVIATVISTASAAAGSATVVLAYVVPDR